MKQIFNFCLIFAIAVFLLGGCTSRPPLEISEVNDDNNRFVFAESSLLNSWNSESERFASSINAVLNRSGSVLIPVFALGKLQEMLASIWISMQKNKITNVDIYTGGIGNKINRIYDYNRFVVIRNEQELILHDIPYRDLNKEESLQKLFKIPSIVLASSGMMVESTKSFELAKRWLRKKDFAILFFVVKRSNC